MDPRDLRPVGPLRLLDRAVALVSSDPRRLVWPVWAGSAPLVLWALAFWVVERVEGVSGLRAVFAAGFALLVGPRMNGWAIAGRTVVLSSEGQDPSLDETRAVVRQRRLALFKAGTGIAVFSMPWLFAIALLSLVTPALVILILPFVGLRWTGAAPSLAARIATTEDPAGRAYVRAWRDQDGNRFAGFAVDVLLWLGTLFLLANGWVFVLLLAELSQELFGLDLAFAEAFLNPENGFFAIGLAGVAWLAVEPVRAAVGALLAVDGRVRNEALDLDRMVGALEASRPRLPGAAAAAGLLVLVLAAPASAQSISIPVAVPPPVIEIEVDPLPDVTPVVLAEDGAAREAARRVLTRREYREALGTRGVGFFQWLQGLFEGLWGSDDEPWDPDLDGVLPSLPLPTPWVFVGFAALVLLVVLVVLWPRRRAATTPSDEAAPAPPDPREQAPEEIVDEAEALFRKGDVAGALRRLYLATLVALDRRRLIVFDPAMTNWQYLRHLPPGDARTHFAKLCRLFDHKWYGKEPATEAEYHEARAVADALLARPEERLAAA